jgi:hypothetical protein
LAIFAQYCFEFSASAVAAFRAADSWSIFVYDICRHVQCAFGMFIVRFFHVSFLKRICRHFAWLLSIRGMPFIFNSSRLRFMCHSSWSARNRNHFHYVAQSSRVYQSDLFRDSVNALFLLMKSRK